MPLPLLAWAGIAALGGLGLAGHSCANDTQKEAEAIAERAKDLAYRLYTIAARKKWAQEAYAYNALVVAWPEIQSRAAELKAIVPQQLTLEDFMNNNN